jgi:hypothetical protein
MGTKRKKPTVRSEMHVIQDIEANPNMLHTDRNGCLGLVPSTLNKKMLPTTK